MNGNKAWTPWRVPLSFPVPHLHALEVWPLVTTVAEYSEFKAIRTQTHRQTDPHTPFFCGLFLSHDVPFPGVLFCLFACHKLLCPSNSLHMFYFLGGFPRLFPLCPSAAKVAVLSLVPPHSLGHTLTSTCHTHYSCVHSWWWAGAMLYSRLSHG